LKKEGLCHRRVPPQPDPAPPPLEGATAAGSGATAAGFGAGRGWKVVREVEGVVAGGRISWRRRCRAAAPWEGGWAGEERVGPPHRGRGPPLLGGGQPATGSEDRPATGAEGRAAGDGSDREAAGHARSRRGRVRIG
jgi:hypothetical protein